GAPRSEPQARNQIRIRLPRGAVVSGSPSPLRRKVTTPPLSARLRRGEGIDPASQVSPLVFRSITPTRATLRPLDAGAGCSDELVRSRPLRLALLRLNRLPALPGREPGVRSLQLDGHLADLAGEPVVALLVVLGHRGRLVHADVRRFVGREHQ